MKENYIQEDEIDLRELFKVLWDKKILILLFTIIVTALGSIYALRQAPIIIYEAKGVLEVGSYNNNFIEFPQNLVKKLEILNDNLKKETNDSFIKSISLSKGTTNLIEINTTSNSSEKAEELLNEIFYNLKKEHNQIIDNYNSKILKNINYLKGQLLILEKGENKFESNVVAKFDIVNKINELEIRIDPINIKNTKIVGNISVTDNSSKPKKSLIVMVSCVTGFILSIFLVFFMQFIQNFRGEKND